MRVCILSVEIIESISNYRVAAEYGKVFSVAGNVNNGWWYQVTLLL